MRDLWLARGLIFCLDKRTLSVDLTTSCHAPILVFRGSIFSDVHDNVPAILCGFLPRRRHQPLTPTICGNVATLLRG